MLALRFLSFAGFRRLQSSIPPTCHRSTNYPCLTPVARLRWSTSTMEYSAQSVSEDETAVPLSRKKCVPCSSKNIRPMNEEAARLLLEKVPGWDLVNCKGHLKLKRFWKVRTFMKGLDFFKIIADVSEAEGHHPDLHLVNWNDVFVEIWTHAVGGLTENDFILAAKINELNVQGLLRKGVSGASSTHE